MRTNDCAVPHLDAVQRIRTPSLGPRHAGRDALRRRNDSKCAAQLLQHIPAYVAIRPWTWTELGSGTRRRDQASYCFMELPSALQHNELDVSVVAANSCARSMGALEGLSSRQSHMWKATTPQPACTLS